MLEEAQGVPTGWAGPGPKGGAGRPGALQHDHPLQPPVGASGARFAVMPPLCSGDVLVLGDPVLPTRYTHPVLPVLYPYPALPTR